MMKFKRKNGVSRTACFFFVALCLVGCETMTAGTGVDDAVRIKEMDRRIIELEKKVADLTREVAELNERTVKNEAAFEAYISRSAPKTVEEETIVEAPALIDLAVTPDVPSAPAPSTTGEKEVSPNDGETAEGDNAPPAVNAQALYDRAISEIMDRKAESALTLFTEFVAAFPNDELTDNASYWIGECYYLMSDYKKALDQFNLVTINYPDKDKMPDALLKAGYCYEKLGENAKADEIYDRLIRTYPETSAADLAREKLK